MRVAGLAGMQIGELGGDRLAQQDAAGLAGERHAGGVALRPAAAMDRRAPFRRHIVGVDDVLDPEWHTRERALSGAAIEGARGRNRRIGIEILPSLDLALARRDPVETGARDSFAGQPAGADRRRDLARRERIERLVESIHVVGPQ